MTWPAVTPVLPAPVFVAYRSGAWYGTQVGVVATTNAIVADTAYAFPIFFEVAALPDQIAATVGTSTPGVTARLALYDTRRDTPAPGRLIVGSLTDYDCGAAANTPLVLALPPGLRRPRGFVWGVFRASGAAQPRTVNTNAGTANATVTAILGASTALGVNSSGTGAHVLRVTAPLAYAAAWPDEFPAPTFATNLPGSPVFAWRHA